jgi:hypothetical protein
VTYQPEYVAARSVLLDALAALESHLPNLILVGAQAVYLHTRSTELSQPPMTTDADLALNRSGLADSPEISSTLTDAGFCPGSNPGSWLGRGRVAVDIMIVPWQSGTTKKNARAGRIPPHQLQTARITPGLEPALVDHEIHNLGALDPLDDRHLNVNVAGPAALLVSKAIKIEERIGDAEAGQGNRLKEKDALDLFRLLQAIESEDLVSGLRRHFADDHAREVSTRGVRVLQNLGATVDDPLPALAARAAGGDRTIPLSFVALTKELLDALPELPSKAD